MLLLFAVLVCGCCFAWFVIFVGFLGLDLGVYCVWLLFIVGYGVIVHVFF